MDGTLRPSRLLPGFVLGLATLVSCVDPFGFDSHPASGGAAGSDDGSGGAGGGNNPTVTGSGGQASGSGGQGQGGGISSGAAGTPMGASTGSGGATGVDGGTGGSSSVSTGIGGATGTGGAGTTGTGGTAGTGGSGGAKPDGGTSDAGKPDASICVVKPPKALPPDGGPLGRLDCARGRFPIPSSDPDAPEQTCPPSVNQLNALFQGTAVDMCTPPPHPAPDCPFYFFGWHNYMLASQPNAQGAPVFLSWPTIETVFGSRAGSQPPAVPELLGGVTQAGGRQVLVDQNGHAIYYAIHMNQAFATFVNDNCLTTADAIRNADPMLRPPAGLVETKEAWMIVPDNTPPTDFIVAKVRVPTLHADPANPANVLEDHTQLRDVTVALLAIHIVFTLPGHPEFVWSTFQHIDATGAFDVAPTALDQPERTPVTTVINQKNFLLYKGGTAANAANRGIPSLMLNEATQTFTGQQTSIYRIFPSSKFTTTEFDGDVGSINDNMTAKFATANLPATDRRGHYRLVGATWQDRPLETMMMPDKVLTNNEADPDVAVNGSDSPKAILAGEDRLSSIAMESFTQPTNSFNNCFACHDTRATTARGVPLARDATGMQLLQPKLINVSHIFNEVVRLNP